jgi:hypothetical protein
LGTIDAQLARPYLAANQANVAYGLYPQARGQGLAPRAVILAGEFLAVRAENPVHGADQQSCSPGVRPW